MIRKTPTATAIMLLLLPLSARGLDFDYAKIVDTISTLPLDDGGRYGLLNFGLPVIDGYSVATYAQSDASDPPTSGIYLSNGGAITEVVDIFTSVPGGAGTTFSNLIAASLPSISNGKVAFGGYDNASHPPGVYTNIGGLHAVADYNTPLPSGAGNFTLTGQVSLDGSNVAFYGQGASSRRGIYSTLGGLHKVANQNDVLPGGSGSFTDFANPSANGGNVAFVGFGTSGQAGIYSDVGGTLHAVASTTTPIPNGVGNFNSLFETPSLSAGEVTFFGAGSGGQRGIYTNVGGTLSAVADTATPIPNGSGFFTGFTGYSSLDNGSVAFAGSGSGGQQGIFTNYGGTLVPVVTGAAVIDGRIVNGLSMSTRALSNGNVAFEVSFTNGHSGIYVAEQTYEYVAGGSSAWDTASNWSFALKPRAAVYTNIHPVNGGVVTGPSSSTTIRGLNLGAITSGQAELRLQAGGQLSANEYLYVEPLGKLSVNRSVASATLGILNYGDVDLGGGQINGGPLQNYGTLHGTGTVGNLVYNYNNIQATGTQMTFTQGVYNVASTASIQARSALLQFNGGLSNAGIVNFSFGTSDVFGPVGNLAADPVTSTAGGQIIVIGNSNVTFYDTVAHNGDLFRVSTGSTVVFFGPVSGAGAFTGGGAKFFEGGYRPGNSPASVSLDGPVTFGDNNTLKIELGGTALGTQHDHVSVVGQMALGGTLEVVKINLGNGFNFAPGQSFDILDWNSLSGSFSSLVLPTLSAGLTWNSSQLYTAGVLSVGLLGDFNANGIVDAADYVVWRKGLGTIYTQADYDSWRANFGQIASGAGGGSGAVANTAVPEPATAVLLLIVGLLTMRFRRRAAAP